IAAPRFREGDLRTVGWSADGRVILAAGSATRDGYAYPVFSFDAQSGQPLATELLAHNSITDFARIAETSYGYTSGDGSWGVASERGIALQVASPIADHRQASHLQLDPTGRIVSWTFDLGRSVASFSFESRVVRPGRSEGVQAPRVRRGLFTAPR